MFKVNMEYRVGGRRVSPDQWAGAMADEARDVIRKKVRHAVESLRCDEHHESPSVQTQRSAGKDAEAFTYSYCCEALKAKVEKLLD
jgi:hypothetical protein